MRLLANSLGRLGDAFDRLPIRDFWLWIAAVWISTILIGLIVGLIVGILLHG